MKNKKLTVLSLALVGGILVSCNKNEVLQYNRPFSKLFEFRSEVKSKNSQVYIGENGETIKINDPSDPSVNTVKEIEITEPVVSLYYSNSKISPFQESKQLNLNVSPKTASVGSVTWETSDASIVKVDNDGVVTAVGEGVAKVFAKTENGCSSETKIVVNNNNVTLATAVKSATKILETQNDPSFVAPKRVYVKEDYVGTKLIDGVVQAVDNFSQHIWASVEDSYFRIFAKNNEIKTEGGAPIPSEDSYIFYTTDDYLSYIFCNSNGKANYLTLDQGFLVDDGLKPFDGLSQVLQSYFVAGAKIMTDQLTGVLGTSVIQSKEYSGATYKGSFGENSGEFAFVANSGGVLTASQSDEEDMGIPAGTKVTIEDELRYLWVDNLLSVKVIDEKLSYTIGGKKYVQHFEVKYYYQGENVELLWPDVSNYSLVESIFDL